MTGAATTAFPRLSIQRSLSLHGRAFRSPAFADGPSARKAGARQPPARAVKSFYRECVKPLVVLPTIFLCGVAALALLPSTDHWHGSPGLLRWTNSTNSSELQVSICPRATICSEGTTQLLLIAVARLSGYSLYVAFALAMLTKCYCSCQWLRNTPISVMLPLQWMHELHRLVGIIFVSGAFVHTTAHLVRWYLRGGRSELHLMICHHTGLSGTIAILLLVIAVLPMWKPRWFRRCKVSYETRHWLHLCVVPMGITLCWHHPNTLKFCFATYTFWALDRAYLFFFKTRRLDDVAFMRLDDGSVQMRWKNPDGAYFRAGEYVRIMVPAISLELHPFSVFEYDPGADQQMMGESFSGKKKLRASTFSSVAHAAVLNKRLSQRPSFLFVGEDEGACSSHKKSDLELTDLEARTNPASPGRSPSSSPPLETPSTFSVLNPMNANTPVLTGRVEFGIDSADKATKDETSNQQRDGAQQASSYSQVFISPAGDWTRKLSDSVREWSENGSWITPCWVQGPFLSPFSQTVSFGHLMLVASGIGISAAMLVVQQMVSNEVGREVYLVWMSRSLEQLSYKLPTLVRCTACLVFYTGKDEIPPELQAAIDEHPNVAFYRGRPLLEKIIAWIISKRSVSVMRALHQQKPKRRNSVMDTVRRATMAPIGGAPMRIAPAGAGAKQAQALREETLALPPDVATINAVDEMKVQQKCRVELPKESSWCVLYCGAVANIRATLRSSTRKCGIQYNEESFNW
jgi:hypothetical protein